MSHPACCCSVSLSDRCDRCDLLTDLGGPPHRGSQPRCLWVLDVESATSWRSIVGHRSRSWACGGGGDRRPGPGSWCDPGMGDADAANIPARSRSVEQNHSKRVPQGVCLGDPLGDIRQLLRGATTSGLVASREPRNTVWSHIAVPASRD